MIKNILKKLSPRRLVMVLLAGTLLMLQFCSPAKKAAAPARKLTYIDDVKPIIVANCGPCHTGGRNSDLHVYADCKDLIDESLLRIRMQPGDNGFMPERRKRLSDSLIQVLAQWKTDGLLEKAQP
jgi:cytochrome c553